MYFAAISHGRLPFYTLHEGPGGMNSESFLRVLNLALSALDPCYVQYSPDETFEEHMAEGKFLIAIIYYLNLL